MTISKLQWTKIVWAAGVNVYHGQLLEAPYDDGCQNHWTVVINAHYFTFHYAGLIVVFLKQGESQNGLGR